MVCVVSLETGITGGMVAEMSRFGKDEGPRLGSRGVGPLLILVGSRRE